MSDYLELTRLPTRAFPRKLWTVINEEKIGITWDDVGLRVQINFEELDKYLQTGKTIFGQRNVRDFCMDLFAWGFRRSQEKMDENEEISIEIYFNEFFRRNYPNLMHMMTPPVQTKKNLKIFIKEEHLKDARERDPCFRTIKPLSDMEKSLNHLATVKLFDSHKRSLKNHVKQRKMMNFTMGCSFDGVLEETSKEEVITVGGIAGSYGGVHNNELKEFFGSHIPIYALEPSEGVTASSTAILEISVPENFAQNQEIPPVTSEQETSLNPTLIEGEEVEISTRDPKDEMSGMSDISHQLQKSFDVLYN
ncbi:hypothetical protein DMENIID0001_036640 [Sergentomyia squamirostris]